MHNREAKDPRNLGPHNLDEPKTSLPSPDDLAIHLLNRNGPEGTATYILELMEGVRRELIHAVDIADRDLGEKRMCLDAFQSALNAPKMTKLH